MGQGQSDIGQEMEIRPTQSKAKSSVNSDFVLEKSIFNNVFEKDIRRVYIYKKAERLAKAIHLIAPAFSESMSLKNKIDTIAIQLVEAAILPSGASRAALSRELLALSSVLSIARTSSMLSAMNAELITKEAHILLQEVASYEEPRLFMEETPTLSSMVRNMPVRETEPRNHVAKKVTATRKSPIDQSDKGHVKDRREAVLSVIKNKHTASIKDISTYIRGVSEKTIQRELSALVTAGVVLKQGERRWSTYSLP